MKISNGKTIMCIATIHTILTVAPFAYGLQFAHFSKSAFFAINRGFFETGRMDYETFAAFWCFFFGVFLFPLGIIIDYLEKKNLDIPKKFIYSYLIAILIGAYMIPFGGFTVFMLPHAIYMMRTVKQQAKQKTD